MRMLACHLNRLQMQPEDKKRQDWRAPPRDPFDDFDDARRCSSEEETNYQDACGSKHKPRDSVHELLDLQGPPTLGHYEDASQAFNLKQTKLHFEYHD